MFGIGLPEFILIMALALIVVGPDKLPGLAKTVAKQILELKKAANSLKDSLQEELAEEKESLKELTSGLEGIDVSLADLASAHPENEGGISPPEADDEVDTGESMEETVSVVSAPHKESVDSGNSGDGAPSPDGKAETEESVPEI